MRPALERISWGLTWARLKPITRLAAPSETILAYPFECSPGVIVYLAFENDGFCGGTHADLARDLVSAGLGSRPVCFGRKYRVASAADAVFPGGAAIPVTQAQADRHKRALADLGGRQTLWWDWRRGGYGKQSDGSFRYTFPNIALRLVAEAKIKRKRMPNGQAWDQLVEDQPTLEDVAERWLSERNDTTLALLRTVAAMTVA